MSTLELLSQLKDSIRKDLSNEKEVKPTSDLYLEYRILLKSIASLEKALEDQKFVSSSGPGSTYYEYLTISPAGLNKFKEKYPETVTVVEARNILGFGTSETQVRNILHLSNHLIAVKARASNNYGVIYISKQSVMNLKDMLLHNPLGARLIRDFRTVRKEEIKSIKKLITLDEELNNSLAEFVK